MKIPLWDSRKIKSNIGRSVWHLGGSTVGMKNGCIYKWMLLTDGFNAFVGYFLVKQGFKFAIGRNRVVPGIAPHD